VGLKGEGNGSNKIRGCWESGGGERRRDGEEGRGDGGAERPGMEDGGDGERRGGGRWGGVETERQRERLRQRRGLRQTEKNNNE
jgi:hypothetical protein